MNVEWSGYVSIGVWRVLDRAPRVSRAQFFKTVHPTIHPVPMPRRMRVPWLAAALARAARALDAAVSQAGR